MPMSASEITARIKQALPDADIELEDLVGDENHWRAVEKSLSFSGLTKIKQHQMVYAAFGSDMGTTLHALSLETKPK